MREIEKKFLEENGFVKIQKQELDADFHKTIIDDYEKDFGDVHITLHTYPRYLFFITLKDAEYPLIERPLSEEAFFDLGAQYRECDKILKAWLEITHTSIYNAKQKEWLVDHKFSSYSVDGLYVKKLRHFKVTFINNAYESSLSLSFDETKNQELDKDFIDLDVKEYNEIYNDWKKLNG